MRGSEGDRTPFATVQLYTKVGNAALSAQTCVAAGAGVEGRLRLTLK